MTERIQQNSKPSVMMFCARTMYVDEAQAIGRALRSEHGLDTIYVGSDLRPTSSPPVQASAKIEQAKRGLRSRALGLAPIEAAANALAAIRTRMAIRKLLQGTRPNAVAIFDDRQIRPDAIALRLARSMNIPVILAPYAATSLEADLLVRRSQSAFHAPPSAHGYVATDVARRNPAHVMNATFFYPAGVTLALAAVGELPPAPWTLGAGGADAVCVLGPDHAEQLVTAGVADERIFITGQASSDALAISSDAREELRSTLRSKYNLPTETPIIICAVPQHAEHGMIGWPQHRKATDRLFAALASSRGGVLLSLHPKSKRTDYEAIAARHGLQILQERLSGTLGAADVLVAAFSSTVRWAIGLGIPAIVFDENAADYTSFRNISGVDVVDRYEALTLLLQKMVSDPLVYATKRNEAKIGSHRIGRIDGASATRIADVIASSSGQRTASGQMVRAGPTPRQIHGFPPQCPPRR